MIRVHKGLEQLSFRLLDQALSVANAFFWMVVTLVRKRHERLSVRNVFVVFIGGFLYAEKGRKKKKKK